MGGQLPLYLQPLKIVLPQYLIHRDGHRIGEIQRPQVIAHRDAHAGVGVGKEQILGESPCLLAEHEEDLLGVLHVDVAVLSLGGEVVHRRALVLGVEILQPVVVVDVQLIPVIQPRPLHALVVDGEAQRADEVEGRARGGAGAGDVARVLGNFGLVKNDVDVWHNIIFKNTDGHRFRLTAKH